MLSLAFLRQHPDRAAQALRRRGEPEDLVAGVLELDERRRDLLQRSETLRAQQKRASRSIGAGGGPPPEATEPMRQLRDQFRELQNELAHCEQLLEELLLQLPNLPDEDVPNGLTEADNVLVRSWGEVVEPAFVPQPHWVLGERLGIIDFEAGARLAGSRFFVLRGAGARLQRGLVNWMLDVHTRVHGYTELEIPYLVREEVMVGSGQLPKFRDNLYRDVEEDLWLIPTAEVPLVNYHRGQILETDALPCFYVAHSACFRREKAAAGRDTRGIKRVHQFAKVELVKLVAPDRSDQALETLVSEVESIPQRLGLAYRVSQLCAGELGFGMAKTFDVNLWAPGSGEWLEASSCSNARDFQARRANVRYRPQPGAKPEFVHTLNGSGVALPRTIAALLETYQQADGSVRLPEVLHPYVGLDIIRPDR